MDAKALAKSKRAHSQHHKKSHSIQKPKPPSSAGSNDAANAKNQTGKQIREKTRQAQSVSALPSNWNRYEEEEFDSSSEDPSGDGARKASDVIVPRSKGADFRHLIAEAQSQLHSKPYSDRLPSLDDVLPGDFNQLVGSMLAVRGEGILSWIGNDNFVVEDRTDATPEASFLSLNLHALAEQLEKVDLSERLFMEEDLLPPELHSERSKLNNNQESDQMQAASDQKAAAKIAEEPTPNHFLKKGNFSAKNVEDLSFGHGSRDIDAIFSNGGLGSIDEVYSSTISGQHGESCESRAQDNSNSTSISNKKVLTFEAAAAESELDMLLNSFSETKLVDNSGLISKKPSDDFHRGGSPSLPHARKVIDSPKYAAAITSSFNDILDDLLQETSMTGNQDVDSSKPAAGNSALDDLLDDLLQETSTMVKPTRDVKAAPDNNFQSSPSSQPVVLKSKVLNDFDAWLDTI